MATFITAKSAGEFININVQTTTGFWKYEHNSDESDIFANGEQIIQVEAGGNGEFNIISCGDPETPLGSLPTGSITYLNLQDNEITSFDGTGLSSLSNLYLQTNLLTELDVTPLIGLKDNLDLTDNPITPQNWDSILSGLVGINQSGVNLTIDGTTIQRRTVASNDDYNTLINELNWTIEGTFEIYVQPTFITSKSVGEFINIGIQTSTGFWKYKHNGADSIVFSDGESIEVLDENGEFKLIPCLPDGTVSGDITYIYLGESQITSFDGTGLSSLITLYLNSNQLIEFNGTGLSGLTELILGDNQLTSFDGTGLSSLTGLDLTGNPLTTFIGGDMGSITSLDFFNWGITTLETFDGTGLSGLTQLGLGGNQLTEFDGTGLSSLTQLDLINNPLTTFIGGDMGLITSLDFYGSWNITTLETFDGTGLSGLTQLGLGGNQLTEFDGTGLSSLTQLDLINNPLTSFDGTGLSVLTYLDLSNNPLTTFIGGDMGLITELDFSYWYITTLETFDVPKSPITGLSGLTSLNLKYNQLTEFDGTGLSGLTGLYLNNNQLTEFDGTGLTSLTELYLGNNLLIEFDGTGLSVLTSLDLYNNPLTTFIGGDMGLITSLDFSGNWNITTLETFDGTGLSSLTDLNLVGNQLTSFDGTGLSGLTSLDLTGNPLTTFIGGDMGLITSLDFYGNWSITTLETFDGTGLTSLTSLNLNNNPIIASENDSILSQLERIGLENGTFLTTGGRTAAGTGDYDTLISRGWTIEGAEIPLNTTWYRFKAPSTEAWDGTIGVDGNEVLKDVWLYQSAGFTYYDFLTTQSIGEVKFNVQGTEIEIVATQVPVTLQEFSSSGSFTAGIGFEGNAVGYANTTAFGSWGTLNSGTLPAIPSRYEGEVPAGSVIFSNIATADFTFCLITAPILLSLTVNGNEIGLKDVYGSSNGASFPFELVNGETYIFSMTWGELVEATPLRKLRVKGLTQRN